VCGVSGWRGNLSERLAARGVTVAAGYSRGKDVADAFCEAHPGASAHQGNIGSSEDCERVIQEVLDTHGRLDILVNNTGITLDKTVRKMTVEDWDRVIQVNPVRRVLPVPGDPAAHARPRIGPHHQHQLDHR
jgi:NAD(P)-dependent dehydrogenase (short-subunit alcohol dehydrogenase family)